MSTMSSEGGKIFADTMNTVEMAEHRRKNGIVLLPLGCFEMHGLHAGMACDCFLAEAVCRVLAEEWDAVILPGIPYTYPGATARFPGTVCVLPRETMDYVIAVTKGILRNGFKRVVLVNLHGPSSMVVNLALRTIFEETGETPISFEADYNGMCQLVEKEWGHPHAEAALYLAALYICGRHGEFDPALKPGEVVGRTFPYESFKNLVKHGVAMPYYHTRPEDHVGTNPGLTLDDAPRVAEIYRDVVRKSAKGLPEDYEAFQEYTRKLIKDAPWDR